ncbi:hypothetical protein WA15_02300, partial [Streptococcus agalactiae]
MTLTFLDFFAGVGGFRRGLELAGMTCLGYCEKDKFARNPTKQCTIQKENGFMTTSQALTPHDFQKQIYGLR